jgi:hypothetical protein
MIKTEDVVAYIEKTTKCKLFDFQVKLLDNIIHGKITDTPRNMGKTFVINGYASYLNYAHGMCKYDNIIVVDDFISGEEMLHSNILSIKNVRSAFEANPDKARREYNMEFTSVFGFMDENAFKEEV